MIDHITIYVSNYEQSKQFYTKAFGPLGYTLDSEFEMEGIHYCGFADSAGKVDYWIVEGNASQRTHIAIVSPDKEAVHNFHKVAIGHGGQDNGKPGPRPEYGTSYYAAFVLDPDGNNIEAMLR